MNETLHALIHLVGTYDEALKDRLLREIERRGDPPPPDREGAVVYFRFAHMFASGHGSWEYAEAVFRDPPTEEEWDQFQEDYISELSSEYTWTDMYRGIELERLEGSPPVDWITGEIRKLQHGLRYRVERLDRLRRLLKQYPKENET